MTLVLIKGYNPPPVSSHIQQLQKGLTYKAHNPMLFVAKSHRKAYNIQILKAMSHTIASTNYWSKLWKQAVLTTILLAIWGRSRLSELLSTPALKFKPSNVFLCNDL